MASWKSSAQTLTICLRVASKWLCFQFHRLFWDVKSYIIAASKEPLFQLAPSDQGCEYSGVYRDLMSRMMLGKVLTTPSFTSHHILCVFVVVHISLFEKGTCT